jgi:hypothetical protein
MKRRAIILKTSFDMKRAIAVDELNTEEILAFLHQSERYRKKFLYICELILRNHINRELYDKEEPTANSKGVRAMKFFKGQENARIYCKEVNTSDMISVVVASELLVRKKQTKLSHKELSLIKKVAQYEYVDFQ